MTLQVSMIHTSAPHGENSKLVMDATTNKRDKEPMLGRLTPTANYSTAAASTVAPTTTTTANTTTITTTITTAITTAGGVPRKCVACLQRRPHHHRPGSPSLHERSRLPVRRAAEPQERGHDRSPSTARGDDESVRSKTQRRATASEQQRPRWVGTWSSNTSSSSSSASSSSTQSTRPAPTRPALAAVTPASGRFDTTSSLLKRRSAPDIGQNLARRNSVARVEAIAPSVSSIKSSIGARRGSVQSVNIKRVSDRDSTLSKQKGQNTTTLRPRKINSPTHDLDRQSRSSASSRLSIRTDEGSPSEQGEHDVTVEEPETKRDGASTPRSRQITSAGIAERSPVLIRQLSQALPPERISLSIESPMLALDTETHASRRRPETFLTASACLDTTPVYSTLLSIAEEAEAIEARIADDASSTMHSSSASLHSGGTEVNSTGAGSESYDGSKFGRESSLAWQEAAKILQKDGKSGHRRVQSFVDILLLKGFREQEPKRHSPSASQCDAASIRSEILLHSQSESPEMTTVRSRDVSVSGIESFPRHSTSSSISIKTLRSWFLGANNTTAPSTDQPVPGIEKPDKRKKHESDRHRSQEFLGPVEQMPGLREMWSTDTLDNPVASHNHTNKRKNASESTTSASSTSSPLMSRIMPAEGIDSSKNLVRPLLPIFHKRSWIKSTTSESSGTDSITAVAGSTTPFSTPVYGSEAGSQLDSNEHSTTSSECPSPMLKMIHSLSSLSASAFSQHTVTPRISTLNTPTECIGYSQHRQQLQHNEQEEQMWSTIKANNSPHYGLSFPPCNIPEQSSLAIVNEIWNQQPGIFTMDNGRHGANNERDQCTHSNNNNNNLVEGSLFGKEQDSCVWPWDHLDQEKWKDTYRSAASSAIPSTLIQGLNLPPTHSPGSELDESKCYDKIQYSPEDDGHSIIVNDGVMMGRRFGGPVNSMGSSLAGSRVSGSMYFDETLIRTPYGNGPQTALSCREIPRTEPSMTSTIVGAEPSLDLR